MIDQDGINRAAGLSASQLADIRIDDQSEAHFLLSMTLENEPLTMFLMPNSIRSEDFEVLVEDPGGELRKIAEPPPSRTVRGTIIEWAGSVVVGSLIDGRLTATIRTSENEAWFVQPATSLAAGIPNEQHIVYRSQDVLPTDFHCDVEDESPRQPAAADRDEPGLSDPEPPGGPANVPTLVTEISFDADVEFFVQNGSSVNATVDDIETVMVGVDAIYRSQVNISYVVNRIIVRTSEPDPYTSTDAGDLRDELRSHWEDGPLGSVERDIVHLMTGKDLDGTVIGKAWIGAICDHNTPFHLEYGLSQSRFSTAMAFRVALTAHELGHNWDATHCAEISGGNCPTNFPVDCGIMCACIGGCNGSLTVFGASAREDIRDHRNSSDCLNNSSDLTYVDAAFSGTEFGSILSPYNTLREGIWATDPNGTVIFFGGTYDANRTIRILNRPVTLKVLSGTGVAVIGQ